MYLILFRNNSSKKDKEPSSAQVYAVLPQRDWAESTLRLLEDTYHSTKFFMLSTEEYAKLQAGMSLINELETIVKL